MTNALAYFAKIYVKKKNSFMRLSSPPYSMGKLSDAPPRVGFWPYPQTLDNAGQACRDRHSNLLQIFLNYGRKRFMILAPVPNVIKLFSSKNYNFLGKLFQT